MTNDEKTTVRIEATFECRTCSAYRAHPDKADVGECRRRAPVPVVMVTRERPEVDEHGRIKGCRLTVWPGVGAADGCMEYQPSADFVAQLAAQHEASLESSRH